MSGAILHINGWAGSGKRTIGAIVAGRVGARLVDNHALLNPVLAVYDWGDPRAKAFRRALRDRVFAELKDLPADVPLVFTDALADDSSCRSLYADVFNLARDRGAALTSLVLTLSEVENVRRLSDPARVSLRKLTRPEILIRDRAEEALLFGEGDRQLTLDVTDLSAEEAAEAILQFWP